MEKERIKLRKKYVRFIATQMKVRSKKGRTFRVLLPRIDKKGEFWYERIYSLPFKYKQSFIPYVNINVKLIEILNVSVLLRVDFNGWGTKDVILYINEYKSPAMLIDNFEQNFCRRELNRFILEEKKYVEVKRVWDEVDPGMCQLPDKFVRVKKVKNLLK